jgi:hypothetical protein
MKKLDACIMHNMKHTGNNILNVLWYFNSMGLQAAIRHLEWDMFGVVLRKYQLRNGKTSGQESQLKSIDFASYDDSTEGGEDTRPQSEYSLF